MGNSQLPTEKAALRTWAKQQRAELDLPGLSQKLVTRLANLPEVRKARHLMLYLALADEINVEPLIGALADDGIARTFYVPRCAPSRRLALHAYVPGETPLRVSAWGIREPDPELSPKVKSEILDLVIVPALLVTPDGKRLGYGGGYYDRFLPRLRPEALRIAAIPTALVVENIPVDDWDTSLHKVVTEVTL